MFISEAVLAFAEVSPDTKEVVLSTEQLRLAVAINKARSVLRAECVALAAAFIVANQHAAVHDALDQLDSDCVSEIEPGARGGFLDRLTDPDWLAEVD